MTTRVMILKLFKLRRIDDTSIMDDGSAASESLPLLGEYHAGEGYTLTDVNAKGFMEAIAKGFAK